jgi:hypothetical protein
MSNGEWKAEFKQLGIERVRRNALMGGWSEEKVQRAYTWLDNENTRYQRRANYISILALLVAIAALIVLIMALLR